MPTPAYMTIEGLTQGNISAGASSEDSIGNTGQAGHEDEILIQAYSHQVMVPTNDQNGQPSGVRKHKSFIITKSFDKSSPLLFNALCKGERLKVNLKWYRTATSGKPEHYYTIALEDAVIVNIESKMAHCLDPENACYGHEEIVSLNYRKIDWRHEVAGTSGEDDWKTANQA